VPVTIIIPQQSSITSDSQSQIFRESHSAASVSTNISMISRPKRQTGTISTQSTYSAAPSTHRLPRLASWLAGYTPPDQSTRNAKPDDTVQVRYGVACLEDQFGVSEGENTRRQLNERSCQDDRRGSETEKPTTSHKIV